MSFPLSDIQLIESIRLWDMCKCEMCQKEVEHRKKMLKENDEKLSLNSNK